MEYVIVALIVAAVAFVAFRKRKPTKTSGAVDSGERDAGDKPNLN
jgi:hypothetical protein